jgi:hypothetical protein
MEEFLAEQHKAYDGYAVLPVKDGDKKAKSLS